MGLDTDLELERTERKPPPRISMNIDGNPGVSWCPNTTRLHQGVSHNGSTPQDLTELLVIREPPDY